MSSLNELPIEAAAGTAPFRDEIFKWPIASLKNVDVWDLIFKKYVTHPTDQQNLVLASPQFFGPLLKERKCSNLFGEVLDILHRKHYLTLSKKEFLCFRGLSKTCKISIDSVTRVNNHCFLHDSGIQHDTFDAKHVCWNSNYWTSFLTLPALKRKIKKYSDMKLDEGLIQFASSLPGLWIQHSDVERRFPNFQELLSPVGLRIYHLKISLDSISYTWNESYRVLHALLVIMPNLVTLRIEGYFHCAYYGGDKEWSMQLDQFVEAKRLPSLNRLIYLHVESIPTEVANALFAKFAGTLEKLSMESEPVITITAFLHSIGLFSKANMLTDLWISVVSNDFSRSMKPNLKWPASLKNVCLQVKNDYGGHRRHFQPFCNALLGQFAGANHRLFSLSIFIEGELISRAQQLQILNTDFRISLPLLTRLWIYSSVLAMKNIYFILGVSNSLEELVLNLCSFELKKESEVELIWFQRYWHRMYESNIWEKMPNLRKLIIRNTNRNSPGCYEYIRPAYDLSSTRAASGAHFSCD